jgi:branched-chain amino acid transport system permease protein
VSLAEWVQQAINAISLGSTYALLALGLAVVYNMLNFVNFAHGELLTLGAFTLYLAELAGSPWALSAVLAVLAAGAGGVLMERVAFRPVRGSNPNTLLLTSFALSVIIQALLAATVSPRPQPAATPSWLTSSVHVAGTTIGLLNVLTICVTIVAFALLTRFFQRTRMGISVRASSEDFDMARMLGIPANRVVMIAFAISGLLAGLAALVWTAKLGTVQPGMGLVPMLKAFIGAVLGGLGSLSGAAAGGFALGVVEVALQSTLPTATLPYVDAVAIVGVVVILLARPSGLLVRRS